MKAIVLGCGGSGGVPLVGNVWGACNSKNRKNRRTRVSILIKTKKTSILVDCSPDMRQQLLRARVKKIDAVLITHAHADHVHGIDDFRSLNRVMKKDIDLYADKNTLKILKKRFDYCFKSINGYPAIVKGNIIKKVFSLGKYDDKINFNTTQVIHGRTKTTAYIFERTAYISDCNDLSIVNMKIFQNLKHLIIDCLKIKKSPVHFNLDEALYVHSCLKPKKTILTNLNFDLDYNFLLKRLPKNVLPAYDGLKLNL